MNEAGIGGFRLSSVPPPGLYPKGAKLQLRIQIGRSPFFTELAHAAP